jgi:hypothetical protein
VHEKEKLCMKNIFRSLVQLSAIPSLFTIHLLSACPPLLPHFHFVAMSEEQEDLEDNMQLLRQQQLMAITQAFIDLLYQITMDYIVPAYLYTPYHTSALSGEAWVQELLAGHPKCIAWASSEYVYSSYQSH